MRHVLQWLPVLPSDPMHKGHQLRRPRHRSFRLLDDWLHVYLRDRVCGGIVQHVRGGLLWVSKLPADSLHHCCQLQQPRHRSDRQCACGLRMYVREWIHRTSVQWLLSQLPGVSQLRCYPVHGCGQLQQCGNSCSGDPRQRLHLQLFHWFGWLGLRPMRLSVHWLPQLCSSLMHGGRLQ